MTNSWAEIRGLAILVPIALLFVMGFVLAIKSGVLSFSTTAGLRRAGENLSQTVLLLTIWLALLILVQHLVGYRVAMPW